MPVTTTRMTHDERRKRRRLIAEHVKAGNSLGDAARKYNVSVRSAEDACLEFDVKISPHKAHDVADTTFFVIAMLLRGVKQVAIANEFRISKQRVSQIVAKCRKAGIPLPGSNGRKL